MRVRLLLSLAEQRMHADLRRLPPCGCGSCTVPCLRRRGPNAAEQPKQVEDPPAVVSAEGLGEGKTGAIRHGRSIERRHRPLRLGWRRNGFVSAYLLRYFSDRCATACSACFVATSA